MKYLTLSVLAVSLLLLFGCAQPQPKGYVSIEKSPIKITYIDYHNDITPYTVQVLVNQVKNVPYKSHDLNEKNEVIIGYSANIDYTKSETTVKD